MQSYAIPQTSFNITPSTIKGDWFKSFYDDFTNASFYFERENAAGDVNRNAEGINVKTTVNWESMAWSGGQASQIEAGACLDFKAEVKGTCGDSFIGFQDTFAADTSILNDGTDVYVDIGAGTCRVRLRAEDGATNSVSTITVNANEVHNYTFCRNTTTAYSLYVDNKDSTYMTVTVATAVDKANMTMLTNNVPTFVNVSFVGAYNMTNGAPTTASPDTIPPGITLINLTSEGGLGQIIFNQSGVDNRQSGIIAKTNDTTPTFFVITNEPATCAVIDNNNDLNWTLIYAGNANFDNGTETTAHILTLNFSNATTRPRLHNFSIGCKDTVGNENSTSTSGKFLVNITDPEPPTITLEKPDDQATLFFKDIPFRFNFTATDDFGLLNMSCSLYFNNTLNQTNSSVVNGTLTNWALVNLSRGVWRWNVSCSDDFGNINSSARTVTINNSRPSMPTLQTPANNSGFGNQPSNLPEFTWNNSVDDDGDTITYTIEVNNQSDFNGNRVYFNSSVLQDSDGTTGVNVTLPSNDENAYFWRVRANDSFENSSFSQTFQFAYANWTITFNLTSSDTGKQLDTSGPQPSFDVSCTNEHSDTNVDNPHTDLNSFSHGTYNCTFSEITDINNPYRDKTITFTADSSKTVEVVVSRVGGLTEEEHNWLQFLYNCFNSGECIDLLRTINKTTKDIWKRVTGTDTSVITFENITSNTLSSTSNISIDYTINIPTKEGYAVGALLPLRMFFWITDVNKTRCFNQDKANDTNRAEAPYCLPLVAETLGPNGGQVNFTVDLRPNIPNGEYNITRSIEIDPIVNNEVTWVNYGQDNVGQIKVLESGNADLFLLKTGESLPVKTQTATGITGVATATQLTTTVIGIVTTLSIIILGLLGYIIYKNKKK